LFFCFSVFLFCLVACAASPVFVLERYRIENKNFLKNTKHHVDEISFADVSGKSALVYTESYTIDAQANDAFVFTECRAYHQRKETVNGSCYFIGRTCVEKMMEPTS